MPRDDTIKPAVVAALIKDGWTITADPYRIEFGTDRLLADLAAERPLVAADRGPDRIAVEIKSFIGASLLSEFHAALGQFTMYQTLMRQTDPGRRLFVGVSEEAHAEMRLRPAIAFTLTAHQVPFVIVRLDAEEVVEWTR